MEENALTDQVAFTEYQALIDDYNKELLKLHTRRLEILTALYNLTKKGK